MGPLGLLDHCWFRSFPSSPSFMRFRQPFHLYRREFDRRGHVFLRDGVRIYIPSGYLFKTPTTTRVWPLPVLPLYASVPPPGVLRGAEALEAATFSSSPSHWPCSLRTTFCHSWFLPSPPICVHNGSWKFMCRWGGWLHPGEPTLRQPEPAAAAPGQVSPAAHVHLQSPFLMC